MIIIIIDCIIIIINFIINSYSLQLSISKILIKNENFFFLCVGVFHKKSVLIFFYTMLSLDFANKGIYLKL